MSEHGAALQLVFIWHMHQPDYRDRAAKLIRLPWVRLHALKDYYDMPKRLEQYPELHQTFNLVPSLVLQLEDYLSGDWEEVELSLFKKSASDLSEREKHAILERFFNAPREKLIDPHPRYASLLREARLRSPGDLLQRWTEQEWRDLQFWRQLSWVDPMIRERDPQIDELIRQGQNFTEEQKYMLWDRMKHWIGEAFDVYKRLQEAGIIEISVSPFYHPILPLLIDPSSAREAMPECPLPKPSGCHPDDAAEQVERAIRFYEKRFGRRPRGVWPSEGSVSQAVASLLKEAGIEWFASDEEILARSLGRRLRNHGGSSGEIAEEIYRPYKTLGGEGPVILFRDHRLSDLIGFEYQHWDPEEAADHFVAQLLNIRDGWRGERPPLVPVILDGENCWEYYDQDGGPFLDALFDRLQKSPSIACVTVSEALARHPAPTPLERLAAGSWINGDFHIWIGEESDRKAWGMVEKARRELVEAEESGGVDPGRIREAWEEIYVAEGSDWFWWFGDAQPSEQAPLFDEMFRSHVVRVYELLDSEVPKELLVPLEIPSLHPHTYPEPTFLSPPHIDGRVTHYYEWLAAARFDPIRQGSVMRAAEKPSIRCLYYGGDRDRFYLRADPVRRLNRPDSKKRWELQVTSPRQVRIRFIPTPEGYTIEKLENGPEDPREPCPWRALAAKEAVAAEKDVFEASLSWDVLEMGEEGTLSFFLGFSSGKGDVELTPSLSCLCMTIPGKGETGRPWFP